MTNKELNMFCPEKPREPSIGIGIKQDWDGYSRKTLPFIVIDFDNGVDAVRIHLDIKYFENLKELVDSVFSELQMQEVKK